MNSTAAWGSSKDEHHVRPQKVLAFYWKNPAKVERNKISLEPLNGQLLQGITIGKGNKPIQQYSALWSNSECSTTASPCCLTQCNVALNKVEGNRTVPWLAVGAITTLITRGEEAGCESGGTHSHHDGLKISSHGNKLGGWKGKMGEKAAEREECQEKRGKAVCAGQSANHELTQAADT